MRALFALVFTVLVPVAAHAAAPDGKGLFATRCGACHQPAATKSSPAAPKIAGVAGRKVASLGDYAYSTALKAKGGQMWSDANLDAYLAAPNQWAPGTKMFVGLSNPAERKAVFGYLKTLK